MFLNTLKSLIDNNFYIYPPTHTPFLGFIINPLLNIFILFIYFSAVCLTCNAKWHYNEERHFQLEFLNRFMTITSAGTVKHNTQRDARTQTHKAKMQQREWGGGKKSIQKSGLGTRRQTVQEPQTVLYKKGELVAADWSVNWPSSS